MEDFARLFGGLLVFVYHCLDRVVIRSYLPLLTRARRTSCTSFASRHWRHHQGGPAPADHRIQPVG